MEAGETLQQHLSEYLQFEIYHVLGAYSVAAKGHDRLAKSLTVGRSASQADSGRASSDNDGKPNWLRDLAVCAARHNRQLSSARHGQPVWRKAANAAVSNGEPGTAEIKWPYREPMPERFPLTKAARFDREERRGVVEERANPWKRAEIWERLPRFYSAAVMGLEALLDGKRLAGELEIAAILASSVMTQLDHLSSHLEHPDTVAPRLARYRYRRRLAHGILCGHLEPSVTADVLPSRQDEARLELMHAPTSEFLRELGNDNLKTQGDSLPLFVVSVLTEAHLCMHAVETWHRMCLGERAETASANTPVWLAKELARCVELNTFAYCASRTAPWLFTADRRESMLVRDDTASAWKHTRPARGMWIAEQISLLALHRRAFARSLQGDHDGAYNDYHKLQKLIRDADRRFRIAPIRVQGVLDCLVALDAQAHHHIGDLYRAEGAQRPARKHFHVAEERFKELKENDAMPAVLLHSRRSVELLVSYGKSSYEMGYHKESLCWHLRAWRDFLKLLAADSDTTANVEQVQRAISWLEHVRFEPELHKNDALAYLGPVVDQLDRVTVSQRYGKLAGEILSQLGHVMLVLDLPARNPANADDEAKTADAISRMGLGFVCLTRAYECDRHSVMAIADLLKAAERLTRPGLINADEIRRRAVLDRGDLLLRNALSGREFDHSSQGTAPVPGVGQLWPRGGSDFKRLASVAEYLTLRQHHVGLLDIDDTSSVSSTERVAGELLSDFFMNSDSINVRRSQGYDLLMKKRHRDRVPPGDTSGIELICMRRYSAFFPLLPRPSAFSALCGGYFIRLHIRGQDVTSKERETEAEGRAPALHEPEVSAVPDVRASSDHEMNQPVESYGVVIDPGVDFVETLYRAGCCLDDIDMIVVTHDHVDHAGALDALISLLHVRARTMRAEAGQAKKVTILLARSVYKRFRHTSLLQRADVFDFQCIEKLAGDDPHEREQFFELRGAERFPEEFRLIVASSRHVDKKGHLDLSERPALGLCFRARGCDRGGVAFTSDMPCPPDVSESQDYERWTRIWRPLLDATVLVAHLSNVPQTELRQLAVEQQATLKKANEEQLWSRSLGEDENALAAISTALQGDAKMVAKGVIEYGLWLRSAPDPNGGRVMAPIAGPVPHAWTAPPGQLFLQGLLRVADAFGQRHRNNKDEALFVVGELSEELGTMRSKIAERLNENMLVHQGDDGCVVRALTGDIGLTVFADEPGGTKKVRVLCAVCALDTDRIAEERYHLLGDDVSEVCVKGENEGIFYTCREHSPERKQDPILLEQLERFDTFGR